MTRKDTIGHWREEVGLAEARCVAVAVDHVNVKETLGRQRGFAVVGGHHRQRVDVLRWWSFRRVLVTDHLLRKYFSAGRVHREELGGLFQWIRHQRVGTRFIAIRRRYLSHSYSKSLVLLIVTVLFSMCPTKVVTRSTNLKTKSMKKKSIGLITKSWRI